MLFAAKSHAFHQLDLEANRALPLHKYRDGKDWFYFLNIDNNDRQASMKLTAFDGLLQGLIGDLAQIVIAQLLDPTLGSACVHQPPA